MIALSPAELARRLDHRFQVLAGGRRGAVDRHATLRAAIDWSFDLLTEAEQRLLARMAVFSGGSTLEAVEDICSGDPVPREDILDLVTGLVARSLVIAEDSAGGTRFRLLETIRQYSEEQLAALGEVETLLDRHATYFADLSARSAEHFYGPEQVTWARAINLERDNIRAALATAIDTANAALSIRLVATHPHHHAYGGMPSHRVEEIPAARVIDLPDAGQQAGYPRAVMAAAWHAWIRGDQNEAIDLRRRALDADQHLPDAAHGPSVEIDACNLTAMVSLAAGDYTDAVSAYHRAAELATADGYPGLAAINLAVAVNTTLLGGGESADSVAAAEHALALARKSGMEAAIVISLNSLALTIADLDALRATTLLEESVERSASEVSPSGILTAALVAGRLNDWDLALALAARSLHLERWVLAPLQVAPCLALFACATAERQPEVAGILQGAAYATFRRAASEAGIAQRTGTTSIGPNANFVLTTLHAAGDVVVAALGEERARDLRSTGKAMGMSEAIAYALSNVDR